MCSGSGLYTDDEERMAKYGSVSEYVSTEETWFEYVERLELHFVANGITDAASCFRHVLP